MHVLIVKDNLDDASGYMYRIRMCMENIHPRLTITQANISDSGIERSHQQFHKVIFLISSRSQSLEYIQNKWIGKTPESDTNKKLYKIILLDSSHKKAAINTDDDIEQADDSIIKISNIEKDVFKWWPQTLAFLFGMKESSTRINKAYCMHYVPSKEETIHPVIKQLLEMLKTFGAQAMIHSETKKCCIVVCTEAVMKLPKPLCTALTKQKKSVFAIALSGRKFSTDIMHHTDRQFCKFMTMEMIVTLMTDLNLINAEAHNNTTDINKPQNCPVGLQVAAGYIALLINLPAMIMHLAICMVFPWPLVVWSYGSKEDRLKNLQTGFVVIAVIIVLALFSTIISLYYKVFPILMSMTVIIYLLVWQIGVSLTLYMKYNYKYGIFSIPYELAWRKNRRRIFPN